MSAPKGLKINDREWRKLQDRIIRSSKTYAKVGILQSKGGGKPHRDSSQARDKQGKFKPKSDFLTVVEIATIHEFGAANVPQRSFIRRTFIEKEAELKKMMAVLSRAIVLGRMKPEQALNVLGQWGAAEVKKRITGSPIPPPLAASTIAAKGSTRPLVDTAQMLNAIAYEIAKGGA